MTSLIDWLSDWGGWVIGLIATFVAVKGNVQFDVNQWLNDRVNRRKEKARRLCPHVRVASNEEGQIGIHSSFVSPSGTVAWQCQSCGVVTHDDAFVDHNTRYWAAKPKEISERHREIDKLLSK